MSADRDRSGEDRHITVNRKARYEFFILDTYEAGISLAGTEVKSLRSGQASIKEAYARIQDGEVWLINAHINPYEQGSHENLDPRRPRKLLLRADQVRRLLGQLSEKGLTLVPLRMYFKGRWAKVELGLARGKKLYDKREAQAAEEARRDIEREIGGRAKGRDR